MKSKALINYLNNLFQIEEIQDSSKNGLQVQAPDEIETVAFAVDACADSFAEAGRHGAQLLIVHHGLYWKDVQPAVGTHYKRLKILMDTGIGLYAVHLPLDRHPVLGNNSRLVKILGMEQGEQFGVYKGVVIGQLGIFERGLKREDLLYRIEEELSTTCKLLPFGPERVKKVGVVSGGGTELLPDAVNDGCDSFLTGEYEHNIYHLAKESGLNIFMAGHYATETVGLRALQSDLEKRYKIETVFIDLPTGL